MNVKESQNVRDSNYELMRVISMCMIVIWHILLHGLVEVQSTGILSFVIYLLEAFLVVHVNSYILVTGYYQCRKKFQLKKLIALNNQSWFYRIIIMFILCGNGMIEIRRKEFFQAFFPLDYATYWFVQMYLFLYCFSPFLNRLIEKISKKEFQVLLMICLVAFSILPTISMQVMIPIEKGHSLMSMVFMYLLGAYFRYYPIQESRILKVNTRCKNQLLFLLGFIIFSTIHFLLLCFGKVLLTGGEISQYVGETIQFSFLSYGNPFVIISSLMYFFWFGTLEIKSKFINRISSLTLGVYLIHDNPYMRQWLYPFIGFVEGKVYTGILIIGKVFLCAIVIFIICAFLEWIRQLLFKGVNHLKITKWFQRKWRSYVTSLGDFDLMKEC